MSGSDPDDYPDSTVERVGSDTLILSGPITEATVGPFMAEFCGMDRRNRNITLYLSSTGGEEGAGFAIYDAIRTAKNEVLVRGYGEVMSIGALILMAGDTREMTQECRFMVHEGSVDPGNRELRTLRKLVQEYDYLNDRYIDIIAKRSVNSLDTIRKLVSQETFLSAEECLHLNVIHNIYKGPKNE